MDAYVSKPLQPRELIDTIESLARLPRDSGNAPGDSLSASEPSVPIFDRAAAMQSVEGDLELLAEVIRMFVAEYPQLMTQVRAAIEGREMKTLRRVAHSLRGAASQLGADSTANAALVLETMGQSEDLTGVELAFADLTDSLNRLQPELLSVVDQVRQ
jgi:HPt (histidine-containing phosphotransfer) domain-containing protein